jgi:hypothetical protein
MKNVEVCFVVESVQVVSTDLPIFLMKNQKLILPYEADMWFFSVQLCLVPFLCANIVRCDLFP